METEIPKQEFSIRKLGTKSVTLYPTKAHIIRNINGVSLKPGLNQITISGLTPTCDEHSIKVDGTGAATITDLTVELVPNPEVYADIYPDEDEGEVSNVSDQSDSEPEPKSGRSKEIVNEIAKLRKEKEGHDETTTSVRSRMSMIETYLGTQATSKNIINLGDVISGYREERARLFIEHTSAKERSGEIEKEITALIKEERRLGRDARKAKEKADKEKAKLKEKEERKKRERREEKERIRNERAKFWPKKVYKITISLEAPSGFTPASSRRSSIDSMVKVPEPAKPDASADTAEINLALSYITYSASWTPRYDLSLNTVNNTGALDYSAELTNLTSETWRDAKVVLSTSQSSYQGLSDSIPVLRPWHIRLAKGYHNPGPNAALQSAYEQTQAMQNHNNLPPHVNQPRNVLFGLDPAPSSFESDIDYEVPKRSRKPLAGAKMSSGFGSSYARPYPTFDNPIHMESVNAPPASHASRGGAFGTSQQPNLMMARARVAAPDFHGCEGAPEDSYGEDLDQEALDGATIGDGIAEQALLFEESSFEESGLTTTYDLPSLKTLAPTATTTKHKIARVDFKGVAFSHVVVPKQRTAAFLQARLRNASKLTLLKGAAGLTLDGSFLGQSTVPRCAAGDGFTLNLGVDPGVTVGYARPSVQRSSSGLFSKEDCEVFTRVATVTNTKANAAVELTLLEQVPVSEDERLKIEILTPRGLRLGGEAVSAGVAREGDRANDAVAAAAAGRSVAGSMRAGVYGDAGKRDGKWGSAVATAKKGGEISFAVKINPGRGCKLVLEYEATYPGGETVVAAMSGMGGEAR